MKRTLVLLLVIMVSLASVHGETTLDGRPFQVSYKVLEANSGNVTWFSPDYSESYNYSFDGVDQITVSFDSLDLDTNFSISIGDFKVSDYPDSSLDGNLALGYYEYNYDFGFISSTNWSDLMDVDTKTVDSLDISSETLNVSQDGGLLSVGVTVLNISSAFQKTILKYDNVTGVLVEAETGFGNYFLHIKAEDAVGKVFSAVLSNSGATDQEVAPLAFISLLAIPVVSIIYRRKIAS